MHPGAQMAADLLAWLTAGVLGLSPADIPASTHHALGEALGLFLVLEDLAAQFCMEPFQCIHRGTFYGRLI